MTEPSVGAVYRLPSLLRACVESGNTSEFIRMPSWEGIGTELLVKVAQAAEYLIDVDGHLAPTYRAEKFMSLPEGPDLLKRYLSDVIDLRRETWTSLIFRGQQSIVTTRFKNLKQCFEEAGLLDQDVETVAWWDRQASVKRTADEQIRTETGRQAELMSVEYEERRTGRRPRWSSVGNTYSPYDLLSQVSSENSSPLLIEVKGSLREWEYAWVHLSRKEWETLSLAKNACFHIWILGSDQEQPVTIGPDEVRFHIPQDQAEGKWVDVKIPFSSLSERPQ